MATGEEVFKIINDEKTNYISNLENLLLDSEFHKETSDNGKIFFEFQLKSSDNSLISINQTYDEKSNTSLVKLNGLLSQSDFRDLFGKYLHVELISYRCTIGKIIDNKLEYDETVHKDNHLVESPHLFEKDLSLQIKKLFVEGLYTDSIGTLMRNYLGQKTSDHFIEIIDDEQTKEFRSISRSFHNVFNKSVEKYAKENDILEYIMEVDFKIDKSDKLYNCIIKDSDDKIDIDIDLNDQTIYSSGLSKILGTSDFVTTKYDK